MKAVTVKGDKYTGTFKAHRETGKIWIGSEVYQYEVLGYWFEGEASIQDIETGEVVTFRFSTHPLPNRLSSQHTLSEFIQCFYRSRFSESRMAELDKLKGLEGYDLNLADLVLEATDLGRMTTNVVLHYC